MIHVQPVVSGVPGPVVVARVVRPATRARAPLPSVSYALKLNLMRGGLQCDLFFAHDWDEGIYELSERVLSSWPDDARGAYICALSNPQNFDIDGRLHAGAVEAGLTQLLCRVVRAG